MDMPNLPIPKVNVNYKRSTKTRVSEDRTVTKTNRDNLIANRLNSLLEPRHIKQKAKAESKARIIQLKGNIKEVELIERARRRSEKEEIIHQQNIESILEKALPKINQDSLLNNVDQDWLLRFLEHSKVVSDDELQEVWSGILAGEAHTPKSYSRKTLRIVSDLSREDAQSFNTLSSFVWIIGGKPCPLIFDIDNLAYASRGITFERLLDLENIGLIKFNHVTSFSVSYPNQIVQVGISYQENRYHIDFAGAIKNAVDLGSVVLTKQGTELLTVCHPEILTDYELYSLTIMKERGVIIKKS